MSAGTMIAAEGLALGHAGNYGTAMNSVPNAWQSVGGPGAGGTL